MIGLVGGILGGVIGIVGGLIGTYVSIKRVKGPKERAFMVRVSIVIWLVIIGLLALLFALPSPYNYLIFIPYGILLPFGIAYSNRTQQRLRREETPPS
jgi:uncharacterized membrane protein YfcA